MSETYEFMNPSEVIASNAKVLVRRIRDGRVAMCKPSWFAKSDGKLYAKSMYNSLRLSVIFMF
jgi:hypothetical protein